MNRTISSILMLAILVACKARPSGSQTLESAQNAQLPIEKVIAGVGYLNFDVTQAANGGCRSRALIISMELSAAGYSPLTEYLVFDSVDRPENLKGIEVRWFNHAAAAVKQDNDIVVIDPSFSETPLGNGQWVQKTKRAAIPADNLPVDVVNGWLLSDATHRQMELPGFVYADDNQQVTDMSLHPEDRADAMRRTTFSMAEVRSACRQAYQDLELNDELASQRGWGGREARQRKLLSRIGELAKALQAKELITDYDGRRIECTAPDSGVSNASL